MNYKHAISLFTTIIVIIFLVPLISSAEKYTDCKKCHKDEVAKKVVHPAVKMGCTTCHVQAHQKGAEFPKYLFAEGVDVCWACHDKAMFTKKVVHPPVAKGECLVCHNPHSTDNQDILRAPVPDLCFKCHDKTKFKNKSTHPPVAAGMCTICHDPHSSDNGKLLILKPPKLCFMCHVKDKYISDAKKKHHAPVLKGLCLSCHNPHASASEKLLLADVPDLCFKCHIRAEFKGKYNHYPVSAGMCLFCHEPHQGDVKKLLVAKPPELCFKCHDNSDFTRKYKHPPVSAGMCTLCHNIHGSSHVALLDLPITDLCLQCHPGIGKAPHAAGTFTQAGHPIRGRKDPKARYGELTCASCHNQHSSDYIHLFRYPAKSTFELCPNCHGFKKGHERPVKSKK
ncbi:MAG TPA: hypothetical protein ENI58_10630 [Nitrospirae bacterium]|nr:hypothetical protein [Nitrospirota bacterium]